MTAAAFLTPQLFFSATAEAKKVPAVIQIKGCQDKKPPVKFEHKKHHERLKKLKMDCKTCHHKGSAKDGPKKGNTCTKCHLKPTKGLGTCKDKSKKKNPFHVACIGCHKKLKAKAELKIKKAPTKCKGCHPKK